MSYEQISNEMAEIVLRSIARDDAQEHDEARYALLKKKLEAMDATLDGNEEDDE